jgi:hypothetical protein
MRLHIADSGTGDPREPLQGCDLVEHVVGETCGLHVDAAATKPDEIAIADLGSDRHLA